MNAIHWFRHDLRTTDHGSLEQLTINADSVACIYVFDPREQENNEYDLMRLGSHRYNFIMQSLIDLERQLKELGINLYVFSGEPEKVIQHLIDTNDIDALSIDIHHGVYERRSINRIQQANPSLELISESSHYLYKEEDLPFSLENMPDTFSPFRRKVEKYCEPRALFNPPTKVAPLSLKITSELQVVQLAQTDGTDYTEGETGALERIEKYFFEDDLLKVYKETRNGLDGWSFSSRLSAYLALGCISPVQVLHQIKRYESERVSNDSTYWLFFELLWREFFHWSHLKHGAKFFAWDGIQQKRPSTVYDKEKFKSWANGETGFAIVDACMKQLNKTGFMSNRGRQLVASCFVHELNLDWRYGAAYFEQQLIDFDVASNWGNWQYLAGVGSDPRGHRQFNLEKQTQTYDPDRKFIDRWLS